MLSALRFPLLVLGTGILALCNDIQPYFEYCKYYKILSEPIIFVLAMYYTFIFMCSLVAEPGIKPGLCTGDEEEIFDNKTKATVWSTGNIDKLLNSFPCIIYNCNVALCYWITLV